LDFETVSLLDFEWNCQIGLGFKKPKRNHLYNECI